MNYILYNTHTTRIGSRQDHVLEEGSDNLQPEEIPLSFHFEFNFEVISPIEPNWIVTMGYIKKRGKKSQAWSMPNYHKINLQ